MNNYLSPFRSDPMLKRHRRHRHRQERRSGSDRGPQLRHEVPQHELQFNANGAGSSVSPTGTRSPEAGGGHRRARRHRNRDTQHGSDAMSASPEGLKRSHKSKPHLRSSAIETASSPTVYAQAREQLERSAAQDAIRAAKRTRDRRKAQRVRDIRAGFSDLTASPPGRATALVHGGGYGHSSQLAHVPRLQEGDASRFRASPQYYQTGAGAAEAAMLAVGTPRDRAGGATLQRNQQRGTAAYDLTENIFAKPEARRGNGTVAARGSVSGAMGSPSALGGSPGGMGGAGVGTTPGKAAGSRPAATVDIRSTWADPESVAQTMVGRITQHVAKRAAQPPPLPHSDNTFLTAVQDFDRFHSLTLGAPESLKPGDEVPPSLVPVRFYQVRWCLGGKPVPVAFAAPTYSL